MNKANLKITEKQATSLNSAAGFLSFKPTWVMSQFLKLRNRYIMLVTGNQATKTSGTAYNYVLRILGKHPVAEKNIVYRRCRSRYCENGHKHHMDKVPADKICIKCGEEIDVHSGHKYHMDKKIDICTECGEDVYIHKRGTRTIRFASLVLPTPMGAKNKSEDTEEVKNSQYPEFKKWLPKTLIKKDITHRTPAMSIRDIYGGADILIEFMSYKQPSKGAGIQRVSVWLDESSPKEFYDEQLPRLFAENGDIILTLTPANYIGWEYDALFEKASVYYRTNHIVNFYKEKEGRTVNNIEYTDSPHDIAIIQAASDDNPTLSSKSIDELLDGIDDPDEYAIRRFGIFRQVSGRIFKDFSYKIHFIKKDKWFPDGIPHVWKHFRGVDYHPETDWHYGSMSLSDRNEAFIWRELIMSPDRYVTREMAREFSVAAKDYRFTLNLIDPLSEATKKDSITVLDDFNRAFYELKQEGFGGGYWQTWDTKGEKGRDEIRKRLKNALRVEKPFNNLIIENGKKKYLPTIWILDNCPVSAKYMKQWRWKKRSSSKLRDMQGDMNEPEQKYSHENMVWEAIFKDSACMPPRIQGYMSKKGRQRPYSFQGGNRRYG